MCGILGQWNRDGSPVDLARIERAATAIRHRGPDDEGYLLVDTVSGRTVLCGGADTQEEMALPHIRTFVGQSFDLVLGFRRLSILDLSASGHQPMAGRSRRHWIVFNGEIYNYLELRAELQSHGHTFVSDTDTEVILAAYAQWGPAAVERLRGMFAFCIWDSAERRLWLARDRFGIKPLFTAWNGARFTFSSEIKALAVAGAVDLLPDATAAGAFVALGMMPPADRGATFFTDVRSVPAAHSTLISVAGLQTGPYWAVPEAAAGSDDVGEEVAEYRRHFDESIRLHLRSDVPVGTCLSGGLDSSSIVAATARLIRELHAESVTGIVPRTFSAVYPSEGPWNERRFIDEVVARTGAEAFYVQPDREDLLTDLPDLAWHQEEPFATTSIFAQWCVMRLARQTGITVLLDGQGADEVLGGYHSFFAAYLRGVVSRDGVLGARKRSSEIAAVTGRRPPLARELLRNVPGGATLGAWNRKRVYRRMVEASGLTPALRAGVLEWLGETEGDVAVPADLRADLVSALQTGSLPHLLRYEDRNSMAFSIEARVPFLDHPLVERVFASSSEVRIRDGWTKWVARKAIEPELPASITWRRDKVGFATPEDQWLSRSGDLHHLLEAPRAEGWFEGGVPAAALWRHLSIGAWLTHFVARARREAAA